MKTFYSHIQVFAARGNPFVKKQFGTALVLWLLVLFPTLLHGATVTWTNTSGGNWSATTNWSPNQVPGSSDNAIITNGGTYTITLNTSPTVNSLTLGGASGQQSLATSGNNLTLNNSSAVNSNGILSLSGGTLGGTGLLTINGQLNWTGGTLGGGSTLTIASNAVLNISGSGNENLYGVLTNAGTVNWSGTGSLQIGNYAPYGYTGGIVNLAGAVFNALNDQTMANAVGSPYFNNAGTFVKSPTSGTTTIGVVFNNTGTVNVESGIVAFNAGGAGNGTFTGTGTSSVTGGTLSIGGAAQNLLLSGGTVTGVNASISNLTWTSGTLQGTSTVTGSASWTGGTLGGGSTLTIATNGVLNISGSANENLYGVLTNAGTVNWSGTGSLQIGNYAPYGYTGGIVNLAGAVFNALNDQTMANAVGSPYFNNAGTFVKSPTSGTTTIGVVFNNTGTVNVESGIVAFNAGGAGNGTFTGTGTSSVTGGTLSIGGAAQNLLLSGGTVTGVNASISNLTWTSGTLQGTSTVTGSASWTGGTLGGGSTLTIATNGVLNISGSANENLYGVLTNAGTVNWSGTGSLQIGNYAPYGYTGGIVNLAGAVFNALNDQTMANAVGSSYFNNAGTFVKSPTSGTTTIGVVFNNTGTVNVESGIVAFNAGGAGNGTFTGTGTSSVTGGTLSIGGAAQNLLLSGGTVTGVNASISNLTWTSGTLQGTNTITGSASWTAGTLGGASTLTIASNAVLNISGTVGVSVNGVLINAGTVNWTGTGNIDVSNGNGGNDGAIVNLAGAVFNAQNDQSINNGYGSPYFDNAGLFQKSPTPGTTAINVTFNNTGAVNAETGTVLINGGGSSTLNSGSQLTGAGTVLFNSGTLTINGAITSSNLLFAGGTLVGNNAAINGVMNWTGGTLNPGSTLTVASNAVLDIGGSSALNLYGVLTNAGTVNWTGTGTLQLNGGSGNPCGIVNLAGALFNVQNDQTMASAYTDFFDNAGTFLKSAGTNTTIDVPFNNTGIVTVESGTVTFNGGGAGNGTFTGPGNFNVTGGTLTISGVAQNLLLSGGTLNGVNASISNLIWSGGNLQGTSTVTGLSSWTGGTLNPGSTLTVASNAVLDIGGSSALNLYGVLTNAGTVNWTGTGTLQLNGGSGNPCGIVNLAGALFNVQNDQTMASAYTDFFDNAGTFLKSAGTNTTIDVPFNNTGIVTVESGTVTFNGGGAGNGTFNAAAGTTLAFANSYTGNSGAVFSGAGTNLLSGGTFTVSGSITTSNLVLAGATLSANVAISGLITWTSGSIGVGSVLTIASNAVMNIDGNSALNLYGALTNEGTVNWSGPGNLQLNNSGGNTGSIVNLAGAVFNAENDQSILNSGGSPYFNNAGLFQKSSTTGTTTINVTFNNAGTVNAASGMVGFQGQYNGSGGFLGFTLNGISSYGRMSFVNSLALASIGTLQAQLGNGYSPNPGDGFALLTYPSATGNFTNFNLPQQAQWQTIVDPTTYIIVAINSQQINSSYTWTGAVSTNWSNPTNWNPIGVPNGQAGQSITFSNGTLNLTSPITIDGQFNWLGGTLSGNPLTIASNGALSIGNTNVKYLQAALTNAGIAIWGGGGIVLSNCSTIAGSIVNSTGGVWAIWCDQTISSSCANTNSYWENLGAVVKSYGGGTTTVGVPFYDNGGTIELLQGAFVFSEPVSFYGGSLSGNGSVTFNDGLQNNQALSVNGITLTLNGEWTNAGTIEATNAVINLGGNFAFSSLGTFNTSGVTEYLTGTFNNTGTTLVLGSSVGSWIINGGTIEGGTVTTTNRTTLLVNGNGGTLNGVTVNGTLDVGNSYSSGSGVVLSVLNGLTLNGTALVGNPTNSNFGALSFVGSQTLAGNASVIFGEAPNSADNALRLPNANSTLTISSGITIEGQNGTIGYSSEYGGSQSVSVINDGTISGNVTPGTITLAAPGYTQQGILSVTSGNVVNVEGSIFLTGLGLFTIQPGGTIQVTGNVSGNTVNSGEFNASGSLTLNGSGTGSSPQFFEVMSEDLGTSPVGFIHNFTYGTVTLANNTYVRLINQYQNSSGSAPEALYVNSLVVPAGTTLDMNGFNVYARAYQTGGTILNGTVTQVPNSGPIGFGAPTLGNLATVGQLDQWTFFARAGQVYTVLVDPGSDTGTAPYLGYVQAQVVNTNGTLIASATNASSGATVLLSSIAITNDGTYAVQIHAPPGFPSSTGHYQVTVWQTTPNVGSVVLNEIVTGDIQTPYSVDQWNFAATAGQQIRFHLVNVSGAGLGFNLTGPNGPMGFTNLTTDSGFITLTNSGNYTVTAHSLAGQYGVEYAFQLLQTVQTNLALGTSYQGQWAGSGQAVLLQFTVPVGAPMQILLNNLVTNNHANIYVGFGQPPTPTSFIYSSTTPSNPNQSILIPVAAAGTYYILIYGDNIQTPGGFIATPVSALVLLSSCTPNTTGISVASTLTLAGAGFDGSSSVQFINGANSYPATSISVDSFTQITVTEAAGALPPGTYSIKVSVGSGSSATLTNALQVLSSGVPNLVTSLTLPGSIGYHVPATIYAQFGNNGGAAMPAPLLVLTAVQNGIQGAFLTLDPTLVAEGLWTSAEPAGFSHSVQFLASGQTPGLLQPGESFQTPVYYAGWQQPWNFSYPPVDWNLGVIQANDTTTVDWSTFETNMEPSTIPFDAWDAIYTAFTNTVGTTWGGYVTMLDNNSAYLGRLGINVTDISKLLAFQFLQADGICPLRTLASSVDASVPTPGLPLTFSRSFGERISQRYALGPLGRGWSHNWQYSLQQGSDGTITIFGPGGSQRIFQPDTRGGYFAQAGDYGTLSVVHDAQPPASALYIVTEKSGLSYFYGANGNLDEVRDLNNNSIAFGYTGTNLTSLTHSSGQHIQIAYNGVGLIQTVTDQLGHQTILTYDAANQHLTGAQYSDGRTTAYTYNNTGPNTQLHALRIVAPSGSNPRYFNYDSFGRLATTWLGLKIPPVGGSVTQDQILTFTYGLGGQVTVTDALGNPTQFNYDNNGLLIKTVDADGNAVHLSFDNNYNLVSVMDPAGRSYNYGYDGEGNVTSSTDPLANQTQFTFTSAFNRLASVTDAKGNPTHYSYDPYGNLQSITYADGSVEDWSYDSAGNPQTWNNRRGHQTFYTFNNSGQVTGKYFADGSVTSYSYDTQGNLTNASTFDSELNPLESSAMTYDSSNRLTQITYPGGKYLNFTYYSTTGRRASSADQLGHQLNYYYDADGRLQSMTNELNALVVLYQYDLAGRVASKTLGNGMAATYQYDSAGQLLSLTNLLANATVLSSFNYSYDSRGRRTTMNTLDGNWIYTYDDVGQLTHAVYAAITTNVPNQDLTYIYDSVGNRTQTIENGVTTSYTANNLNQYSSVGQTNYTFDADGNLIREVSPQGTTTYTYNDENRLVSMTSPQGNWQYTYDGFGSRTMITANGDATRDVIDPFGIGNVVGEYNSSGNLVAHYDHALGLLSRIDASANWVGYAFDGIGNVQQIVSAAGAIMNGYAYKPFGGLLRNVAALPNPFQFCGQFGVIADNNGLNFMRNRFFAPTIGRFESPDPINIFGGDANLYSYANNAPLQACDPLGLSPEFNPSVKSQLELIGDSVLAFTKAGRLALLETVQVASSIPGWVFNFFNTLGDVELFAEDHGEQPGFVPTELGNMLSYINQGYDWQKIASEGSSYYMPGVFPNGTTQAGGGGTTGVTHTGDPNQMTGPAGFGTSGFISSSSTLAYRIDFENVTNATAPAQQVIISDQLSTNFDWTTFNVSEIGFGDLVISIPPGTQQFQKNVPFSYLGTNFQVQIQAGINLTSGQVSATFRSIDPTTSLPPPANIGFLPPEDGTGRGQGHVTYTIRAKSGLPNGTQLTNVALISFDGEPQIATDQLEDTNPAAGIDPTREALITLDSIPPTSYVLPLPAQSQLLQIPIYWIGQDYAGGPGIASYNIYVSDNGGAWTNWLSATTNTNAMFQGKPQHTYGFTSQAIDNAGLIEPHHTTADTTTLIVANPLFQFTVTPVSTNLTSNATFSYIITVKNIGTLSLSNVTMSNAIPAGIDLDYVEYGHGSSDIEDTYLLWSLGNMNTNFSATMTVTATAATNGTWTNLFVVADSQGAASANAVQVLYIGVTPPVLLNIALTNNQVTLFWATNVGIYGLQSTTNLVLSPNWAAVTNTPSVIGSSNAVTLPITNKSQFFRLQSQ